MDLEGLIIALGAGGALSSLARAVALWIRPHLRGRRVTIKAEGDEVDLDLSKPSEAARYLESLVKRDLGGR